MLLLGVTGDEGGVDVQDQAGEFAAGCALGRTVLGRRPRHKDVVNLSGTDLGGAILAGAQLKGAILEGAQLERANLTDAQLDTIRTLVRLGRDGSLVA